MKSPLVLYTFMLKNKEIVSDLFLSAMKLAVHDDMDEIALFRMGDSDLIVSVLCDDYNGVLDKLIEYFVVTEQYEKANICKNVKDKNNANRLVRESISV